MAVYVDDANIPAKVGRHDSAWCHLFADTQEELHRYAAQLGLKRSYSQPGKPLPGKPSPFWHYDVTAGKRAQAVKLGAVEVAALDAPRMMRERDARNAARRPAEQQPGTPAGKCPDCTTADLTYGRTVCQACSAVKLIRAREPEAS
jgi:hypothetical protein